MTTGCYTYVGILGRLLILYIRSLPITPILFPLMILQHFQLRSLLLGRLQYLRGPQQSLCRLIINKGGGPHSSQHHREHHSRSGRASTSACTQASLDLPSLCNIRTTMYSGCMASRRLTLPRKIKTRQWCRSLAGKTGATIVSHAPSPKTCTR